MNANELYYTELHERGFKKTIISKNQNKSATFSFQTRKIPAEKGNMDSA